MPDDDFVDRVKRSNEVDAALARATPQQPRRRTKPGAISVYGAGALSRACKRIENSKTRNNDTNEELFNLGQLIAAGELTRQQVEEAIGDACRLAGLGDKEIRTLLRDTDTGGINRGIASGPRDMSNVGSSDYIPPPPPVVLDFDSIEDGFWTSRKSLETIYISALSKMCAPWSVLACCAARALALVRPHITLPDIIGGVGSLNWFGAITATSGGGKGAASATAKLLVTSAVRQRNTGSGEGIINAYRKPATENEPAGLHESVMFMVDEIDSLTAQSKRNGATTMAVLRSAFSGETLGFSYVNKNTPTIEAHTYRMTMVISVQPQRAADLLADYHGGTPQRFMWFPGTDKRVSAALAGGFVESLDLPRPSEWKYPMAIQIPSAARDLILRERVKAMQGRTINVFDGHALFMREKFAFALAVLDGRTSITQEDWELSGVAARVSDSTREWVMAMAEEAKIDEATEKGVLQGVSSVAAEDEKIYRTDEKRARITALIRKHLGAASQRGLSTREEQRTLGRDGKWAKPILDALEQEGLARYDDDERRWYPCD